MNYPGLIFSVLLPGIIAGAVGMDIIHGAIERRRRAAKKKHRA
jgi:hypothetical protein